ncbi:MAG: alpha/beta hydrolase [Chloroflexi bacterium]|nr:alpha/beta hydrolase [Chloroflexota bacterium]
MLSGVVAVLVIAFGLIFIITRPGDNSASCDAYYAAMENPPQEALAWCNAGEYFRWESTLPQNTDFEPVSIFHICQGNPTDPAILMIHGYPTSSFDYAALFADLSQDHYICALDTPGYGFSDKPQDGYDYAIPDDAQLVDMYIREVAGLEAFTLLTHDKGDSVGLALLQLYQAYDEKPYTITHHVITNGNIYLPLAQLTDAQVALLNPTIGPLLSAMIPSDRFAQGIAETTYASTVPQGEVDSLASIFDYQDGTRIQHEIIQYLDERAANEVDWLEALAASDIPTTLIWGEQDAIAPVAVPDHVWGTYLQDRAAPAWYWRIPCADHYLQGDAPDLIATILRATADDSDLPSVIEGATCQALQVQSNS